MTEPSCESCGLPWVNHMGIVGTCAENAKLRSERDEARREVCELIQPGTGGHIKFGPKTVATERGWDCYKKEEIK